MPAMGASDPLWEPPAAPSPATHRGPRTGPPQPQLPSAVGAGGHGAQAVLAFTVVPGPMSCSRDISGGLLGSPSSSELMPGSSPRWAGRPPAGGGGPIFTLHCIFNWVGIKNICSCFQQRLYQQTLPPQFIHSGDISAPGRGAGD